MIAEHVFLLVAAAGVGVAVLGLVGLDLDVDMLKPVPIAAGLFVGGLLAAGVMHWLDQIFVAVTVFVVGLGLGWIPANAFERFLKRSGGSIHYGRSYFQGKIGTVDMAIDPGKWGMVNFSDPAGGLALEKAISTEKATIPVGQKVIVVDVGADFLTVQTSPFT